MLVSRSQLEDFGDHELSPHPAAATHHRLEDGLAVRVPRAAPDIRRDRITRHLALQSNALQDHEGGRGASNQLLLTFM